MKTVVPAVIEPMLSIRTSGATRRRRDRGNEAACRHSAHLQRQRGHDFTARGELSRASGCLCDEVVEMTRDIG
jgi:hypothetical protein